MKSITEKGKLTLYIDRSSSHCGGCGRGANPDEKFHNSVLSYSEEERNTPGCGVEWKYVGSYFSMGGYKERLLEMRPDLEWSDEY